MLKTVKEVDVSQKKVLMRVDFNVPIKNGEIQDDTRIVRVIPTIEYLLDKGAFIILTSHLGRPKGEVKPELSLKPIAEHLQTLLGEVVEFSEQTVGELAKEMVDKLDTDTYRIILLENTRFNPGEKKNTAEFSKLLAELGDIFVSDAFGAAHRAHASTRGVTRYLLGFAGLLIEEEYNKITEAMKHPSHPALAIFGGAKISTKLEVLENFLDKVDIIALGGGMANTFLAAQGTNIGNSLVENEMIDIAGKILKRAESNNIEIILPSDVRIGESPENPIIEFGKSKVVKTSEVPDDVMILDIGPKTGAKIIDAIINAKTIIWNGPVGVFEEEAYREGTTMIAKEIVKKATQTVIGGGETAFAMKMVTGETTLPDSIHISTGGGASLELMAGKNLPGLTCLDGELHPS